MTPETCQPPDTISSKPGSNGDQAANFSLDPKAVEAAARAVCTAYYMREFSVPADHPNVVGNVASNWWIFSETVEFHVRAYLSSVSAPSLPQDVAKLIAEYRPSMPVEVLHLWAEDVKAALTSQSAALASAREVIDNERKNLATMQMTRIRLQEYGKPTAELDIAIRQTEEAIAKAEGRSAQ